MEILTTRGFAEQAPLHAAALRAFLLRPSVGTGLPEETRADALDDGAVLVWERRREQLLLWNCVSAPLAALSRRDLRRLGVAEGTIPRVAAVRSSEEIAALGLPEEVAAKLRLVFLERTAAPSRSPDALDRRAVSPDHFEELLSGRITDLLLNLDPAQRRIVELTARGPIVIRGVAGSGKTSIALHRIHRLSRGGTFFAERPTILLLTYNRALAATARGLLAALGVVAGRDVRVETLHGFCVQLVKDGIREVVSDEARRERIVAARDAARARSRDSALWSHPVGFFEQELHLIAGRGVARREDYVSSTFHRRGAGRPLDPSLRALVWLVQEEYSRRSAEDRVTDWDGVVRLAHERLDRGGAPQFDHVFVDEAQDFTVLGIRLAVRLARTPAGLLFAFDPAQSIFEPAFRWRDAGIAVHGSHSLELRRNYRNTRAILDAARPVLAEMRARAEDADDEDARLSDPEPPARVGTTPRVLVTPRGEELGAIVADLRGRIERREVLPEHVAVLCYRRSSRDALARRLARAGVTCQKHDAEHDIRIADRSVKIVSMLSAKGLEFPVVYVLATGSSLAPSPPGAEGVAVARKLRRVLYMALTRAMSELVIVHALGDAPPGLGG